MRRNKKAQTVSTVVKLIVGIVVVGIMIYLGYKYILGTGKSIGGLGSCEGQGGECLTKQGCDDKGAAWRSFYGMGCPPKDDENAKYCCIPEERLEG